MLENRSFDHMLGFSGITGADAATGQPSAINGLTGAESNSFDGASYSVTRGADNVMPTDPSHEFPAVVEQLCGTDVRYPHGGPYPPINNSGFVASYLHSGGQDPFEIMKCYTPAQLPVLDALAKEFVVCDNCEGVMTGFYNEANQVLHGFVRRADGTLISFDPPGSISTRALSINARGSITGAYFDANNRVHAFVRRPGGEIVSFDAPESTGTISAVRLQNLATGEER